MRAGEGEARREREGVCVDGWMGVGEGGRGRARVCEGRVAARATQRCSRQIVLGTSMDVVGVGTDRRGSVGGQDVLSSGCRVRRRQDAGKEWVVMMTMVMMVGMMMRWRAEQREVNVDSQLVFLLATQQQAPH